MKLSEFERLAEDVINDYMLELVFALVHTGSNKKFIQVFSSSELRDYKKGRGNSWGLMYSTAYNNGLKLLGSMGVDTKPELVEIQIAKIDRELKYEQNRRRLS